MRVDGDQGVVLLLEPVPRAERQIGGDTMSAEGYYARRHGRLIRIHRRLMSCYRADLVARFGPAAWNEIAAATDQRFRLLLEQVPYIGGGANPFSRTLVQAASLLALWREAELRGITCDDFGRLTGQVLPAMLDGYPPILLRWLGALYLSRFGKRRMLRQAARSQQRIYPGDFVFSVVDGDGETFLWGIDYAECGLVKFLRAQGAEALAPYLCMLDCVAFPAMGIALKRSGTIAQGRTYCDFRFSRGD